MSKFIEYYGSFFIYDKFGTLFGSNELPHLIVIVEALCEGLGMGTGYQGDDDREDEVLSSTLPSLAPAPEEENGALYCMRFESFTPKSMQLRTLPPLM